ncbi:MAG TPA: hypothetical protein VI653_01510 [Steroidobacteraceae bacterium]
MIDSAAAPGAQGPLGQVLRVTPGVLATLGGQAAVSRHGAPGVIF